MHGRRGFFQVSSPVSPPLWLVDVPNDPPRRQDAGGDSPKGGPPADGLSSLKVTLWRLGVIPPLGEAMIDARLEELETYITRRQNMVAQYIVTPKILDRCEET